MKTLHFAMQFPIKNSDAIVLCGAKAKHCLTVGVNGRRRLDRTPREVTKAGYRYCSHCLALLRKIQPIGNALWHLIWNAVRKDALFEQERIAASDSPRSVR